MLLLELTSTVCCGLVESNGLNLTPSITLRSHYFCKDMLYHTTSYHFPDHPQDSIITYNNQQVRKSHLQRKCVQYQADITKELVSLKHGWKSKFGNIPWTSGKGNYPDFYVDEKHKLLYCGVPKAASTTMKTLFIKSGDNPQNSSDVHSKQVLQNAGIKMFHLYPDHQQKEMIRSYTKLIIVRNPLARLTSAYQMFTKAGEYLYKIQRYKALLHPKNSSARLTLSDFVTISLEDVTDRNNEHWLPYSLTCNPCQIQYDFILKQETLKSDLKLLEPFFSKQSLDSLHVLNSFASSSNSHLPGLTPLKRQRLQRRYLFDCELFGYKLMLPLKSRDSKNLQHDG